MIGVLDILENALIDHGHTNRVAIFVSPRAYHLGAIEYAVSCPVKYAAGVGPAASNGAPLTLVRSYAEFEQILDGPGADTREGFITLFDGLPSA